MADQSANSNLTKQEEERINQWLLQNQQAVERRREEIRREDEERRESERRETEQALRELRSGREE